MVLDKVKEEGGRRNRQEDPRQYLPLREDPEWDTNTGLGKTKLKQYQQLMGYSMGSQKQRNLSKLCEVRQEAE